MKASLPKKFKSLRDKNGSHRRGKSSEPGPKVRPLSADAFLSMFKSDAAKQAIKEEEKAHEAAKIDEAINKLHELNIHDAGRDSIHYALASSYAEGNVDKAVEFICLQHQAFTEGTVVPYNPNTQMLGAVNRSNVTCYLDALLFAMFAKLEAFECMLKTDLTEEAPRKLAGFIRLWVNMLRLGKLIQVDMAEHLQNALANCGWTEASYLEQQDTSEAFAFITETLQLPLLTLQMDLFHQGKGDKDDHKVVYERLLNLAVPPDPEGKGVKLEDCLEDYFNTKVDVLRDSLEEKKAAADRPPLSPMSTIRLIPGEEGAAQEENADQDQEQDPEHDRDGDPAPLQRRWSLDEAASSSAAEARPTPRHRSTSIIQRIVLDEAGKPTEPDEPNLLQKVRRQGSTVVKAVTIPAWQFFRLVPWHAASNSEPQNDMEVVRQFNQRPVVGICLKRYMMTESGQPRRQNTYIDIPDSLRLPHFMLGSDMRFRESESNDLTAEYKLVLQSVVCHRGDSLHSGHYISFARVNPKLLTDNRRHDHDPPPDYEDAQWVKFDDLNLENRVSYVDDIKEALREEMPYLLFYQIVPMVDVSASSTDGNDTEPPSYNASTVNVAGTQTPNHEAERVDISRQASGYFDSSAWTIVSSTGPSIRFSTELERPPRASLDEESNASGAHLRTNASRRGSLTLTDSTVATPAVTPDGVAPPATAGEESTSQRFSRAAARFTRTGSRSRPVSQAGEGRISLTMSRLGGLMRTSKEPLREAESDDPDAVVLPLDSQAAEGGAAQSEHHHHHHHPLRRDKEKEKERGKSKSRGGDKDKEKARSHKAGVPERECIVM